MRETIKEESMPPDKKAPNGTSAIDCNSIASSREDSRASSASFWLEKIVCFPFSIYFSNDQ